MSKKYPKLDEKTLNEMSQYFIKLPKIDEPIQPFILRNGCTVCTCDENKFKVHDKAGYTFGYCIACGQRYYMYRGC